MNIEVKAIAPLSTKNTITIPKEIIAVLGLRPGTNVLIELVDGVVRLRSAARVNLVQDIPYEHLTRSDSLSLPTGYIVDYQVQKVVKRVASSKRGLQTSPTEPTHCYN